MRLRRIIAAGAGRACRRFGPGSDIRRQPAPSPPMKKRRRAANAEQPTRRASIGASTGPFGKFDRAQLQRGYQVYHDVCSNCHSMKLVAFRDLGGEGRPGFSEEQVKSAGGDVQGQGRTEPDRERCSSGRDGRPTISPRLSPIPRPPPRRSARAPPDMSLLARRASYERGFPLFLVDAVTQYQEEGVDYIYAILNGYTKPDDPNFNEYFPGHHIAMPPPLSDGRSPIPTARRKRFSNTPRTSRPF